MSYSVIIPAYQETEALPVTLRELLAVLPHTAQVVIAAADEHATGPECPTGQAAAAVADPRVVVCPGGGLTEAVRNGALAAGHFRVVVMDADGAHPPRFVPRLAAHPADVTVGAYSMPDGLPFLRVLLSKVAQAAVTVRLGSRAVRARRPTSGMFATSKLNLIRGCERMASPKAFKPLVGVLLTVPPGSTVSSVPVDLRHRVGGKSKLGWEAIRADFLTLLRWKRDSWWDTGDPRRKEPL